MSIRAPVVFFAKISLLYLVTELDSALSKFVWVEG